MKVNDACVHRPFRPSLHLITLAGNIAGCTLDRKQCLDFRRLVAGL